MLKKENIKSVEDFFEAMAGFMDDGDHMCVDTIEYKDEDFLEYTVMNQCYDILYVYNNRDGLLTSEHEVDLRNVNKYIRENVWMFAERYSIALDIIDSHRCSIEYADSALWNDIINVAWEYINDNNLSITEEEVHEMF